MIPRGLAARLGTAPEKVERLLLLLGLAMALVAAAVLARAVADALFLSHAGVESLPLSLVVLAAVSLPVASGLSWLIGRTPRSPLLRSTLVACGGLFVGLRLLLAVSSAKPSFFALTIGVSLVESLLDIQFWVLVADYLSPLEAKRASAYLAIAMAGGGLLGGGAARLLAQHLATPDLLLAVLPFCALAFAILLRLEHSQTPLAEGSDEADPGFVQSLRALPAMARRYPVIALIVAGGLLDVVLSGVGGYLVFGVYEASYPSADDLAGFLGSLSAAMNVAEVLIIFFVTRTLVVRWGLARMNVAYPLTTVAAFAGLASGLRLPVAVAANLNTDTLANALARPVENLTYGAIPQGLAGRVRVLSEGLVQPVGLALVGLLLLGLQGRVTPPQLALAGVVAAVAYVGLGVWRGRSFVASLVAQLRDGSVDLASTGTSRLPSRYAADVDELLAERDQEARCLGLELALRVDPGRYLDAAVSALEDGEPSTRGPAQELLAGQRRARDWSRVRALLVDPRRDVRHGALVALLRAGHPVAAGELANLAADADPGVVALALLAGAASPGTFLAGPRGAGSHRDLVAALISVSIRAPGDGRSAGRGGLDRRLAAWVPPLLGVAADDQLRIDLLTVLARTAPAGEPAAVDAAVRSLASSAGAVRAAALRALASLAIPQSPVLAAVVERLDDAEHEVRLAAVRALEPFGTAALGPLVALLDVPRPEVQAAAIDAIGAIRTRGSAMALVTFLARDLELAPRLARWQAVTPAGGQWHAVAAVLVDLGQRLVGRVLAVMAALGHHQEVAAIRRILASVDTRRQMSAVETVAALPERRLVLPILPLLERLVEPSAAVAAPTGLADELAAIDDRWLRAALAAGAAAPNDKEVSTLQRLLFLKRVSLFSELTLDELLRLDGVLGRREVLAGETVFHQGALEERFYIVFRGEVAIRQELAGEARELRRLGPGETFGEMALFDAAPRSATVVATVDSSLLVLDRERFLGLVAQLPRFATEICRVLTLRLRDAEERLRKAVTT